MTGMVGIWPAMLLGVAMTLTFNKWVNYTMILLAVKEKLNLAVDSDGISRAKGLAKNFSRKKMINNISSALMIAFCLSVGLAYSFKSCNSNNYKSV